MKESETAKLLGFMAAFDRRTVGPEDVVAWSMLPIIRNTTLDLAKEAVIMFRSNGPDERGQMPYLDDAQLTRWIRAAHAKHATDAARARAGRYATGTQTMLDKYEGTNIAIRDIMEMEGLTRVEYDLLQAQQDKLVLGIEA